jgi:hypothetical protein
MFAVLRNRRIYSHCEFIEFTKVSLDPLHRQSAIGCKIEEAAVLLITNKTAAAQAVAALELSEPMARTMLYRSGRGQRPIRFF